MSYAGTGQGLDGTVVAKHLEIPAFGPIPEWKNASINWLLTGCARTSLAIWQAALGITGFAGDPFQ